MNAFDIYIFLFILFSIILFEYKSIYCYYCTTMCGVHSSREMIEYIFEWGDQWRGLLFFSLTLWTFRPWQKRLLVIDKSVGQQPDQCWQHNALHWRQFRWQPKDASDQFYLEILLIRWKSVGNVDKFLRARVRKSSIRSILPGGHNRCVAFIVGIADRATTECELYIVQPVTLRALCWIYSVKRSADRQTVFV